MPSEYEVGEVAFVSQTCETVELVWEEPHVLVVHGASNLTYPGIS